MANFLVLVHSVTDGAVLRTFVVDAENTKDAITIFAGYAGKLEHLVAIPTGSVPDTELPSPPLSTDSVTSEPAVLPEPPDENSGLAELLEKLEPDVLARLISRVNSALR
jgi:hypothetical protein